MRTRPRFRRIAKWTGTSLSILVAASWLLAYARADAAPVAAVGAWTIYVLNGACVAQKRTVLSPPNVLWDWDSPFESRSAFRWPRYFVRSVPGFFLNRYLVLPIWFPTLLIAVPTALLWYRDRRRPIPGHCSNCNYDLTANQSGKCPECGNPVHAAQSPAPCDATPQQREQNGRSCH